MGVLKRVSVHVHAFKDFHSWNSDYGLSHLKFIQVEVLIVLRVVCGHHFEKIVVLWVEVLLRDDFVRLSSLEFCVRLLESQLKKRGDQAEIEELIEGTSHNLI